jgi:hypothetical protein
MPPDLQDSKVMEFTAAGTQGPVDVPSGSRGLTYEDFSKPRRSEAFDPSSIDYMPKEDIVLKVSGPGDIKNHDGPWSDPTSTSPILSRKPPTEKQRAHVITVGKQFLKDGQALRRVKVYEHEFTTSSWDPPRIHNLLNNHPQQALLLSNAILRIPNAGEKILDELMEKEAAIKGLSGAQATLVPLFGSWLNISGLENGELMAASDTIYIVTHDKRQGTIAKALKPLSSDRNCAYIRKKLTEDLQHELVRLWDSHKTNGFCLQIVTPLGMNETGYFL